MLFTTWTFAALLLTTLVVYYLLPRLGRGSEWQVGVLVLSSLIFYAYETPALVFLLLFSIVINAWHSIRMIRAHRSGETAKGWMISAVAINLALLGFFKYAGLIAGTVIPDGVLSNLVADLECIPLPVGISFYTFQAISLVIDLYRGDSEKMISLGELVDRGENLRVAHRIGFFIAFFPQLVAGPIVKAHNFFYQIGDKKIANVQWDHAIKSLIAGFFLKMVVADNLKEVTVLLGEGLVTQRVDLIFLVYGYSFQIFADFAGYSLIAIGLASLFGYRLPMNFAFPYLSASITEFWRRWHISLSTWLREYLYFPLGGNRKGAIRTYMNLFLVMLLGGLWHGAAWSYMIWGGVHGVFLALERLGSQKIKLPTHLLIHLMKVFVIFHLVSFLWLLFLLPDFDQVIGFFQNFANGTWSMGPQNIYIVVLFASPIIFYHLWAGLKEWRPALVEFWSPKAQWWGYAALVFLIITNSGTTGAFVYFQF